MYLKDVIVICENDDDPEILDVDDLGIENWLGFTGNYDRNGQNILIHFSFDFKIIPGIDFYINRGLTEKNSCKIANEQLRMYEYKAINMPDTKDQIFVYRIPRTFTIVYNETTLISTSMRANLYYLYWLLECKDVMRVIIEHLFNVIKCDYSLYICANP